LPAARRAQAYRLLSEVAASREDRSGQLRWLGQLASETRSPVERETASREIDAVLAGLDTADLASLATQLGDAPPADRVWLRLAERHASAGDFEAAAEALVAAGERSVTPESEAVREELVARVRARRSLESDIPLLPDFGEVARVEGPSTVGARGTLGVVLPLSGPFARFGDASLRGVLLAAGVFGPDGEAGMRVLVYDSGGDAARTARAVATLAADPDVEAIVGPLLGGPAQAAAEAAEDSRIPLLALTPREGVADGRDYVFRLALTPRAEAEVLAEHAVQTLGAQRFAILYPADAYGGGLKNLFWDAVEARGARVVGVARYEPRATDFRDPIRRLTGHLLLDGAQQEALRERKKILNRAKRVGPEEAALLREEAAAILGPDEAPLPPIIDFDALFIADAHEKAALIAPQLAFHEVGGVQLLGPSGWNHPDLVNVGGDHLEGAIFTESFFAESRVAFVAQFRARYREAFGEDPDVLAAQAFDAANLVLVQLARGLSDRREMREGLLAVRAYPGVSGITSILSDGNARKRPFLLQVEEGHVVAVD
jgi:ABC-type branched-subunit amino acid transport system substrate-binding protein